MSIYRRVKRQTRQILQTTNPGYRFLLKRDHGIYGPTGRPHASWQNAVLQTNDERDKAIRQVGELGLPIMVDPPKNWDNLAALDFILRNTDKTAHILDAGADFYSVILPWLFLYNYKNLIGINLIIQKRTRRGPIFYEHGDITRTKYNVNSFDVVTCLSVIEHGVNLKEYFKEMSRIIKPGGFLFTSTDFWKAHIDTKGQQAYGVPIHIFCTEEIRCALDIAKANGFELTGPLDLSCDEKVVCWMRFGLKYTFVNFVLKKIC